MLNNREYFVSRLNTINLDKKCNVTNIKFEEFKMFSLNNTGDYYTCIRTEDISNYKVFVKTVHLEIVEKNDKQITETTLTLLDVITTYWSANFHMKSLLLIRDMKEFLNGVKEEIGIKDIAKVKEKHVTNLNILGKFEFHIDISQNHNAKVALGKCSYTVVQTSPLIK
ncbi:hypothetical protein NQ314_020310 [Rhamnusium bicolor]|uniref:Uncharacterized protein n=1 Tax=Rhamnusium bicolor TaxID=1586634 RepID=A0AAV8WLC8_9CUCU|nr:hypothetical protein NQ314_020310 [Rhamnusium bicolor]